MTRFYLARHCSAFDLETVVLTTAAEKHLAAGTSDRWNIGNVKVELQIHDSIRTVQIVPSFSEFRNIFHLSRWALWHWTLAGQPRTSFYVTPEPSGDGQLGSVHGGVMMDDTIQDLPESEAESLELKRPLKFLHTGGFNFVQNKQTKMCFSAKHRHTFGMCLWPASTLLSDPDST